VSASELLRPLVRALQGGVPLLETRSAPPSGDALEGVLHRQELQRCYELLKEALGPPAKEFGAQVRFDRPAQQVVDALGGIRKDQCLFLKPDGDQVAYAALWPWASDAQRVTLRVGQQPWRG
jgi:hypothetical protein